ncbi:hypothetical protein X474_05785 [Dethiosulfatarculus sandiegensis]|uniref:Uncharacterized protein n=1 Tax=Dethiosulfatarculus sandiegensis TaxID=1429043 RepID=A0A0D2JZW8_9BACT|nr:hypothetical protein X474_05785 [Dethiosulfatarculus sandiegensis]
MLDLVLQHPFDDYTYNQITGELEHTPPPEPTPAEALALAKRAKHRELKRNVQRFIRFKPDGSTRYDTDLKLNLMDYINERKEAGLSPAPADAVRAWIKAVQGEYRDLSVTLQAALNQAGIEAVDISLERLEGLFGAQGVRAPDPDIYTRDLWGHDG